MKREGTPYVFGMLVERENILKFLPYIAFIKKLPTQSSS